jgi:hypothetical protein
MKGGHPIYCHIYYALNSAITGAKFEVHSSHRILSELFHYALNSSITRSEFEVHSSDHILRKLWSPISLDFRGSVEFWVRFPCTCIVVLLWGKHTHLCRIIYFIHGSYCFTWTFRYWNRWSFFFLFIFLFCEK